LIFIEVDNKLLLFLIIELKLYISDDIYDSLVLYIVYCNITLFNVNILVGDYLTSDI